MTVEQIGWNAGKLLEIISEKNVLTPEALKKLSKLTAPEMHAALGWLAREDKVEFDKGISSFTIRLKE